MSRQGSTNLSPNLTSVSIVFSLIIEVHMKIWMWTKSSNTKNFKTKSKAWGKENFSVNNQIITTEGHNVFVATTQHCHCSWKEQPQIIHQQVSGWFQYGFIYKKGGKEELAFGYSLPNPGLRNEIITIHISITFLFYMRKKDQIISFLNSQYFTFKNHF